MNPPEKQAPKVPPMIVDFIVPAEGLWYQTRHDYQGNSQYKKPRSIEKHTKDSLPETIPLLNKKQQFYPLDEAWQCWWYALLLEQASYKQFDDATPKKSWASLTADKRAFTDKHAVQNGYYDFIQGIGKDPKKPIAIKALTTGGNLVKVLENNGGTLTIACLDFSQAPPKIEDVWLNQPWLYQWATQETVEQLSDGTYRVLPFPQLKPWGTPVPVGSLDGTQIIAKADVTLLENGKTYRIYNP